MVGVVSQSRQLEAADEARSCCWGGRSVRDSGLAKEFGRTAGLPPLFLLVEVAEVARQDV